MDHGFGYVVLWFLLVVPTTLVAAAALVGYCLWEDAEATAVGFLLTAIFGAAAVYLSWLGAVPVLLGAFVFLTGFGAVTVRTRPADRTRVGGRLFARLLAVAAAVSLFLSLPLLLVALSAASNLGDALLSADSAELATVLLSGPIQIVVGGAVLYRMLFASRRSESGRGSNETAAGAPK